MNRNKKYITPIELFIIKRVDIDSLCNCYRHYKIIHKLPHKIMEKTLALYNDMVIFPERKLTPLELKIIIKEINKIWKGK